MNHYPHHIGDFNNATRHLSRLERSVYRDMLDVYYDTEQPLDGSDIGRLARKLVCVSPEEVAALQSVLDEFFDQQDDGLFVHHRCDREIASFKAQQVDKGAVKSNEKKRQNLSRQRRAAMFSALRNAGHALPFDTKMAELYRLCKEHGVAFDGAPVTAPVTGQGVTGAVTGNVTDTARHKNGTGNQNQNQNQNQYLAHTMPDQPQYVHDAVTGPPDGGARAAPTMATAVCVALRAAGVASCQASSPALAALLQAGATVDVFVAAAHDAMQKPAKPSNVFAYVLATVKGQMADAVAIAAAGAVQAARSGNGAVGAGLGHGAESFRERDARLARERWQDMTGRTHPDSVALVPVPALVPALVVDVAGASLQGVEA